jgi:hypothetical protein
MLAVFFGEVMVQGQPLPVSLVTDYNLPNQRMTAIRIQRFRFPSGPDLFCRMQEFQGKPASRLPRLRRRGPHGAGRVLRPDVPAAVGNSHWKIRT